MYSGFVRTLNFSVINIDCVIPATWGLALSCNRTIPALHIFPSNFDVCMQLQESVDVSNSIYCCSFGHPFDQNGPRNVKKDGQHLFSGQCFWSCFHSVRRIFVVSYQWRLLTGWYVIMARQFVACNCVDQKHIPLFSKASEILFASGDVHSIFSTIRVCGIQWAHIFQYFSFFVMIFWCRDAFSTIIKYLPTHVKSVDRKHSRLQKRIVDEIDEFYKLRENIYHYKKLVSYFYVLYSQVCISVP